MTRLNENLCMQVLNKIYSKVICKNADLKMNDFY